MKIMVPVFKVCMFKGENEDYFFFFLTWGEKDYICHLKILNFYVLKMKDTNKLYGSAALSLEVCICVCSLSQIMK